MTRVQVWVETPDGYELACDEMRPPKCGEHYMSAFDRAGVSVANRDASDPRIIVRPTWQWPAWLKVPAIAMDKCGDWWAFNTIPTLHRSTHEWIGECAFELIGDEVDFSPPPCTDWRQSLRLNPNREAK